MPSIVKKKDNRIQKHYTSEQSIAPDIYYVIVYGIIILRRFSESVTPQSGDGSVKSDNSGEKRW